jgi:hypothetical protein
VGIWIQDLTVTNKEGDILSMWNGYKVLLLKSWS